MSNLEWKLENFIISFLESFMKNRFLNNQERELGNL